MARRIGDVAKAAGVGVETVRFYEREGLVDQPLKPQRGWRDYDGLTVAQLGQVKLARELGLSISDIKRLRAGASGSRPRFCQDVRETLTARVAKLDAELQELEAKRTALQAWLSDCERRDAAAACPLYTLVSALTNAPVKTGAPG